MANGDLRRTDETETRDFIAEMYCDPDDANYPNPAARIETHDGAWIREDGPAGEPVWRWWAADLD